MKKVKNKKRNWPQTAFIVALRVLGIILLLTPFISTIYGDFWSRFARGGNPIDELFGLAIMLSPIAAGALLMIYKSPKSISMPPSFKWLAYAAPAGALYMIANFANNFPRVWSM